MDFSNKTVMVTGAVRNTGLDIAKEFAAAGARVIVNGRNPADAKRVAEEIKAEYGVETIEAPLDISIPEEVDKFFDSLEEQGITIDVQVNNAVVQAQGYSFADTPYDMLTETFRINVFGLFHCAQRVAKMMIKQKKGAIINVGSNTALRPVKQRSAYAASKGAVDALTRAMAIDLAQFNIRVNSVVAGYIHSERWTVLPEESVERRHKNIPIGHECTAKDIARAIMFMASDDSPRTTGSSLVIDGGCSTQLIPADCDV